MLRLQTRIFKPHRRFQSTNGTTFGSPDAIKDNFITVDGSIIPDAQVDQINNLTQAGTTSFGYQQVATSQRQEKVNKVFTNVADNYDLMNDLMSIGIHRIWKDWFVSRLNPQPNWNILDGAGGTGDIAFRLLDYVNMGVSHTASHMVGGSSFIAGNTTIPIGKPLFTIGKALDSLHLLSPIRDVVSNIPIAGDSFKNFEKLDKTLSVTVADINKQMLQVGEQKAVSDYKFKKFILDESLPNDPIYFRGQQELLFKEINLEHLTEVEKENSFDAFTIAFGIRNCTNIDRVLEQAFRILKPGGKIQILEFSHVSIEPFNQIYHEYSFKMIPVMGEIISGDYESYQYLVESIRKFPKQDEFLSMINNAGFTNTEYENLSAGICAIHSGYKPL